MEAKDAAAFMERLACLLEDFDAKFCYGIDDDGVHLDLGNGYDINLGFDRQDIPARLWAAYFAAERDNPYKGE